jgi:hypothetical protein
MKFRPSEKLAQAPSKGKLSSEHGDVSAAILDSQGLTIYTDPLQHALIILFLNLV